MSEDEIPRHLRIALHNAQRAFEKGDTSTLGTINENVQPVVDAAVAWRNRSVDAAFEAGRLAGRREVILVGADTPWPLLDVLKRLVADAEHLYGTHSCDTDGWENGGAAAKAGRELHARLLKLGGG